MLLCHRSVSGSLTRRMRDDVRAEPQDDKWRGDTKKENTREFINVSLAFALFSILWFGAPVFAQNLCADCLKTSQDQLKQCLDSAIIAKRIRSLVRRDKRQKRRSAKRVNARLKEPRIRIEMTSSHRRNNEAVR
jgi:hypothetical protein